MTSLKREVIFLLKEIFYHREHRMHREITKKYNSVFPVFYNSVFPVFSVVE